MARKSAKSRSPLPADTKRAIVVVLLVVLGLFLTLAAFGAAGSAGGDAYLLAAPALLYLDLYGSLVVLGGATLVSLLVLLEGRLSLQPLYVVWDVLQALGARVAALFGRGAEPAFAGLEALDPLEAPAIESYTEEEGR